MDFLFCDRLKSIREDNDVTQAELADILRVTRSAYGRYERGDREPPLSFIIGFCTHFHISSDYLLGLSDSATVKASQDQESTRTNFASLIKQDFSRDPLAGLDEDLYSKGKGYIDALFETQNERNHSKTQEA